MDAIDPTTLGPYETRILRALEAISAQSLRWRAVGREDGPVPTEAQSAEVRAARKLLMVHIGEAARQSAHAGDPIPVSTLRRWCADGLIESEKRGRDWYVDVDDATDWRDNVASRMSQSQRERRQREAQR